MGGLPHLGKSVIKNSLNIFLSYRKEKFTLAILNEGTCEKMQFGYNFFLCPGRRGLCRKRPLVLIQIIFGILELTQVIIVCSVVLASQKRFFLRSLLLEKSHLLPYS